MATEQPSDSFGAGQPLYGPPEEGDELYLGEITNVEGLLDSRPVRFWGQMTFYGHLDENDDLVITQLVRLALAETLTEPDRKDEFEGFSIAGPVSRVTPLPGLDQVGYEFDMQLEHFGLELDKHPYQDRDNRIPRVTVQLGWDLVDIAGPDRLTLAITLSADEIAKNRGWGPVLSVEIDQPVEIMFRRVEGQEPDWQEADDRAGEDDFAGLEQVLLPCAEVQALPQGWFQQLTDVYELSVIFLIFSENHSHNSNFIKELCFNQLQQACKVWWHLCAIKIAVWPETPGAPADVDVFEGDSNKADTLGCGYTDQAYINTLGHSISTPRHCVEICLVDKIASQGFELELPAGCAYPKLGSNNAYCLLEIDQAQHIPYLLAHELGHVLDLDDTDSFTPEAGSVGSIMDIGFVTNPGNLANNTVDDCLWVRDACTYYGAIIKQTGNQGYFFTLDQWS